MSRPVTSTLRALLIGAVAGLVLALATAATAQETDGGAIVPSEPSDRSLTGSYVIAVVVVVAVLGLFAAQRIRDRRSDAD